MYDPVVRIGELSEMTGVSRRLLRYYEQNGLLHSRRSENGWREFDGDAVVRVRNIRDLLEAGLNVADIQRIAPCLDQDLDPAVCHEALAMYSHRLAELEKQLSTVTRHRNKLRERINGKHHG